jgi:hypothetical protein
MFMPRWIFSPAAAQPSVVEGRISTITRIPSAFRYMNDCSSKFSSSIVNRVAAAPDQHTDRANQNAQKNKQEIPMSTRSTILAFAAVAALGVTALATTGAAAATPNHGITNHTSHQSSNAQTPKPSYQGQKKLIGGDPNTWSPKGKKPLIGGDPNTWSPKGKKPLIGGDPNTWSPKCKLIGCDPNSRTPSWVYHHHHHHHHDWRWWYARYHRVVPVETTVVAPETSTVILPAVTKATGNCNCLTKEYLEDGSVLFKDLCTKEAAVATPDEIKAQRAQAPGNEVR